MPGPAVSSSARLSALRQEWSAAAAVVLATATLAVMGWRMLHGLDFYDESYYVALPLRFALGDRPFIDELNISQTAAIVLYPFIKLYQAALGTDGIFLYVRFLYLAFFSCVGWSAYAFARPHLPRAAALLVGAAALCFIPYGAPGLSYNTISMGLFALGLFASARWLLAPPDVAPRRFWRQPLYRAGLAHAAACLAYPSMLLTVVACAACFIALARGRRLQVLALYAAGGVTFALLVSPLFLAAGLHRLRTVAAYAGGSSLATTFGPAGLAERLATFRQSHPELLLAAATTVVGLVAARWIPRLAAAALAVALPLICRDTAMLGYLGSLGLISSFALLGPLLCLGLCLHRGMGLPERRLAAVLGLGVIAPSLLHGVVMAASSSNGATAAGIGMFPAALAAAIALAALVDHAFRLTPRWRPALALAPALLIGALLQHTATSYYSDGPTQALTERIDRGPYWGLHTTPAKRQQLEKMTAELLAHRGGRDARLYYNVPAAYIIAERRPMVASPWIFAFPSKMNDDARSFVEKARPGDLILLSDEPNFQLKELIAATAEPLVTHETYSLMTYRGFGATAAAGAATTALAPLPLDQWRPFSLAQPNEELLAFGWSWTEEGRWSDAYHAGLILPRPSGPGYDPTRPTLVKLDLVPHTARGHGRPQRFKARVAGELVAEGEVPKPGRVVEIAVPARLHGRAAIYLSLELPDAFPAPDGRLLGVNLQRVMLAQPPSS